MSEAVLVRNVYKKFADFVSPLWKRNVLTGARNGGAGEHGVALLALETAVLENISFSVAAGEIFAVVGAENAGKTTLIRLLSGQLLPDKGEIYIFGLDVLRQANHVQRLRNPDAGGVSFFRKYSPLDNLVYAAKRSGTNSGAARSLAQEYLSQLGMAQVEMLRPMEQLGKQEQALVALAGALIASPQLLLLDEPLVGLDLHHQQRFRDVLLTLRQKRGMTVLLTSNNLKDIAFLYDRCAFLEQGRLHACSPGSLVLEQGESFHSAEEFFAAPYNSKMESSGRHLH